MTAATELTFAASPGGSPVSGLLLRPDGAQGLVFLGFPLHPPGRPGDKRAEHLAQVRIPMLFLQGDRDEFADLKLLKPVVKRLGAGATLHLVEGGDHSFHVLKRSGKTDADVMGELSEAIVAWTSGIP